MSQFPIGIQPGDLALINDRSFVIRGLAPEGIYISSAEYPDRLSILVPVGGQWQVYNYHLPHTVRFEAEPVDYLSQLPEELLMEMVLDFNPNEIQRLCVSNREINRKLCDKEHFWMRKFIRDHGHRPDFWVSSWKELYFGIDTVYAFGDIMYHQLALADVWASSVPTPLNIKAQQVAAGSYHTLILDRNGRVYGFSNGYFGQSGPMNTFQNVLQFPRPIPGIKGKQIAAGHYNSYIIDLNDRLYSLGEKEGDTRYPREIRTVPSLVTEIRIKQVAAGEGHVLMLDFEGNVYSFGHNLYGQLGLGDNQDRDTPTLIPNIRAQQIATGSVHSLILDLSGIIHAFGAGWHGQLGLGWSNQSVPTPIPNITGRSIFAGGSQSFIIGMNNELYAFGRNHHGQLGVDDMQDRSTPTLIPEIQAQQVASGISHTLILDVDGRVYSCGSNLQGQLGLSLSIEEHTPKLIPNFYARQISAGSNNSLIVGYRTRI